MSLATKLRDTVLSEYQQAKALRFPMFPITVNGKVIQSPNLMQRMVVLSLLQKQTLGNWSDMGTGKTLAAVLGAYAIHATLTIVCCPNSVKEEWESHIKGVFQHAKILDSISNVAITKDHETFLVVNYEQFQQSWSKSAVDRLARRYKVDLLIFDEIHQTKQRDEHTSKRRGILLHMRKLLERTNHKLYVIGQTGTPCINETLREPISQLELISGKEHGDLPNKVSLPNIFRVRQPLILTGIRCPSNFERRFAPHIAEIDCSHRLADLLAVKNSLLRLDQVLMEEKTPFILTNLNHTNKTIIYVHYVKKLVTGLQQAVERAGFKVETYTGNDTAYTRGRVKRQFIDGDTEALIASKPISVGVDGLQRVCHKMIIPILPWTGAEYRQLACRLERTGQENGVEIIIPQAFVEVDGNRWSMDAVRWHRILHKQTIGDMLTDGAIPAEVQLSCHRVKAACLRWLARVASGKIHDRQRQDIVVEFTGEDTGRTNSFADLHQMHIRLNRMHSSKASDIFGNKEYFAKYHQLCDTMSREWEVIPRDVLAGWCEADEVVGDFGCGGKCHIAKRLPNNVVYSYDHNSLGEEDVICCDIADVPLEDEQLDVAIFSLSLMGCNYKDYLLEAHRCLRRGGKLYIAELTNHRLVETLPADLDKIGFKVLSESRRWKFTFVRAVKR
jgi:superfamily II DNA or RNA helicase